ncbi:MAG TPA: PEP/pyruvate-binding domain-containing protein [Polyangiaceae bacterium]|nr:PEP/pyruvate-binding domain-containing protein [Polyangiaceae bacterium]
MRHRLSLAFLFVVLCLLVSCGNGASALAEDDVIHEEACEIAPSTAPDFVKRVGCQKDFASLSSEPLDATLPGARSGKVVLDQLDGDTLYFQNSQKYAIHYEFVSKNLSGNGKPVVTALSQFNLTEYYSPERRFLLGAVTYYEGAKIWALELAPYDTASAAMITKLFEAIKTHAYFGRALVFHPTSQALEIEAKSLPASVKIKTTDDIFRGTDYQPLNLGEAVGQLRFVNARDLESVYVGFRDLVVLDRVPSDISVVAGLITEEFQTPLSHVNVLAQNRKTPNMGLRKATTNAALRALDGKWVRLKVGAFEWTATEASQGEADAFWESHKPVAVTLPAANLDVKDLVDIEKVTPLAVETKPTKAEIKDAVRAFGAKAANYSVFAHLDDVPRRKAFAVPVFYYVQFMEQNGFYAKVDALLADPEFIAKPSVRDTRLAALRKEMEAAPVDAAFQALLKAKLGADYPAQTMRFRTSTNAEDLDGFPCAGCYDSHTGDPADWEGDLLGAVKKTWATVWKFRTFEERAYHSIDHKSVAMALLVHHNFPNEAANGVATTANPFDPSGLEPGFYVNVQWGGDAEVVAPPPGVVSDQFLYEFSFPGKPVIYLSHSNLVDPGTTVLTNAQIFELGTALDAIHQRFMSAYGPPAGQAGWYAMDCEFKFEGEAGKTPSLFIKQARPYPGRNN